MEIRKPMIPVFRPSCGEEEVRLVTEVLRSGWWGLGPKTKQFEDEFAKFVHAAHAVALNSATAALHLGLRAFGIEGKEVITTSMTFVSTNHAIIYNNAVPVFADIEPDTLNIDPVEIERRITPRTGAIIVVHYGGHPCDLDRIRAIAAKRRLPVLEDAAHACGAWYGDKPIGTISELTSFSFHAVKNLATGDGGMLTTNDPALDTALRKSRWLGINKDTWTRADDGGNYAWAYNVEEFGFKAHMNDITAAIGLAQLARLDRTNGRRREVAKTYTAALKSLDWLELPVEKPGVRSAWHNYVVKVEQRDRFMKHLNGLGISTGMHYIPNHLYDIYKPYTTSLPVTERVWSKLVTLPLFPDLTDAEVARVIEAVSSYKPA
jgi:perosamine synthetase